MNAKAKREIVKKEKRRPEEFELASDFQMSLDSPVKPKKPNEFNFDKEDIDSFSYVTDIGNSILEKKSCSS